MAAIKMVDARKTRLAVYGVLVLLLWGVANSCTTPTETTPPWITGIRSDHPEGTQFVAYGRNAVRREAEEIAQEDGRQQVEQILVQRVEKEGILLTDEVVDRIETISSRRIEAMEAIDRFSRVDQIGNFETYLLLIYTDSDLEEDIQTIESVAIELPEEEPVEAPASSLQRLRALLQRPVPFNESRREELLFEAAAIASEIGIRFIPEEQTMRLGSGLELELTIEVIDSATSIPIGNAPFTLVINGPVIEGNRTTTRLDLITDEAGRIVFTPPAPTYAGTTQFVVEPTWFRSAIETWEEGVDGEENNEIDTIVSRVRATSVLQVTSRAAEVPTAIVVIDRDIAGNPMMEHTALDEVLQELASRGFRVRQVELDESARRQLAALEQIEVADLYDLFPFDVLSSVDRAVVGDAQLLQFDEGDGFSVEVSIDLIAFDLRRDQRLARVSVVERITGSSAQATIRAAFQEVGRRAARQLAPQLP